MEKPNSCEIDEMGNPSFSEIADDMHRARMMEAYRENLIFYKKFTSAKEDFLLPMNE